MEKHGNRRFDRTHGTDTAAEMPLEAAGVPREHVRRGNGLYRPLWESQFRSILSSLPIDHRRFTFVDLGSGKGKLMLLASEFPFRAIIGIEYAPLLHEIAMNNCARYRPSSQRCRNLTSLLGDALDYRLPPGPVFCFMANPFDAATAKQIFANIERDYLSDPRAVCVVYANPRNVRELGDSLDRLRSLTGFKQIAATRTHVAVFAAK